MPDVFQLDTIVVTGTRPGGAANDLMAMYAFIGLAHQNRYSVQMVQPATGSVDGHQITVQYEDVDPPLKPALVQTAINNLRDGFVRVGAVVAALSDTTSYQFGPVTLTGAQLKGAYFALHTIIVTENIYRPGYGGANHGDTLYISSQTASGWGLHGDGGYNFIMLHEMVHNTVEGRAIVQQNFDRQKTAGGNHENYDINSTHFITQESMTNFLTKQVGDQIGVNIDSSSPGSPGYTRFGYYTGDELNPP